MPSINNIIQHLWNYFHSSPSLKLTNREDDFSDRFYSGGNDDVQKDVKRTRITGLITYLEKNKLGRIDGYINFDSSSTIIFRNPEQKMSLGSEVIVDIVRNSKTSPWFASIVEILNCPIIIDSAEDWDDDHDTDNRSIIIRATLKSNENFPHKQIGMITSAYSDNFTLNNEINFSQRDIGGRNGFRPSRGDWVIVDYDHSIDLYRIVGLKPLRYIDYEGRISSFDGRIGFIEKSIQFHQSALKSPSSSIDVPVNRGTLVYGTAIESVQGKHCNFRAITVFPRENRPQKPPGLKMRIKSINQLTKNRLRSPKSLGVNINPSFIDFYNKKIDFNNNNNNDDDDCSFFKEIVLKNENQYSIDLIKIHLTSETNNQFVLIGEGGGDKIFDNYRLAGGESIVVRVRCVPQFPGLDCQQILIDLSTEIDPDVNWTIAIDLRVYVIDPIIDKIDRESIIDKNNPTKIELENVPEPSGIHYLSAAAPVQFRSILTKVYPHKLKLYPIPAELEAVVTGGGDINQSGADIRDRLEAIYPVLKQPINPGNYARKMGLLVHLEEINTKLEMRQFVLIDARPVKLRGDAVAIEVPGLSEGRPSLMLGDRVSISVNQAGSAGYSGSIEDIIRDRIIVRFHSAFHSTYSNEECTVAFFHSRLPFRRMQLGIEVACSVLGDSLIFPSDRLESRHKPSQCLRLSRCGRNELSAANFRREESSNRLQLEFYNKSLNELQRVAVVRIVHGYARPLPYVLFGPPGTGKTVTLVEAILQIYKNVPSARLLVCAPSNSAADLVCLRLIESGAVETGEMVRMNAYRRQVLSETSDKEPIPAAVLPYCKSVEELSEIAMHRIIVCTCISSGVLYRLGLKSGHITHVFVDEAGQASEPEIMVSLGLISPENGQIILAGDPMQLGPVIRSAYAQQLQESYLHRLLLSCELYKKQKEICPGSSTRYNPLVVTQLLHNYRAHPSLLTLPSNMFYDGSLISCAQRTKFVNWEWLPNPEVPLIFHGVRGKELRNPRSPSTYNPSEAVMVVRWIGRLLQDTNETRKLEDSNISVITPYRAQVDCIRKIIKSCLEDVDLSKLKVASVEEFQGQENEVVIISTVRSSLDENWNGRVQESFSIVNTISSRLGFLSNKRRFNVSITRACSLLIVIGDPGLLQYDECWSKLISYCKSNGAYIGSEVSSL